MDRTNPLQRFLALYGYRLALVSIFAFGILINFHYGRRELFRFIWITLSPAWRMLHGELPYIDFTLFAGLTPALMHVPFLAIIGSGYEALLIHACVVNGLAGILVADLLRRLGGGKALSLGMGALTCVIFYPPVGAVYVNNHGYFFILLTLYLQIRALGAPSAVLPLYLLAALAACAGFLTKPTPFVFFLPVLLVPFLALEPKRMLRAVAGSVLGLGVVVALFGFLVAQPGGSWAKIWLAVIELPLGLGAARAVTGQHNLFLLLSPYGQEVFGMIAGFLMVPLLGLALLACRRQDLQRSTVVAAALGALVPLCTLWFWSYSYWTGSRNSGLLFLGLGLSAVALAALIPPTIIQLKGRRLEVSLWSMLLVGIASFDAAHINVTANARRLAGDVYKIGQLVPGAIQGIPALRYLHAYTEDNQKFERYGTPDEVRAHYAGLRQFLDAMQARPQRKAIVVGMLAQVLVWSDKQSLLPVDRVYPGVTTPLATTPHFEPFLADIRARGQQDKDNTVLAIGRETFENLPDAEREFRSIACEVQDLNIALIGRPCPNAAPDWTDRILRLMGAYGQQYGVPPTTP